ncbi:unnamed protein product [Urochloa decumbens]|uniref:serine--tRNA ligase n=1 Tax=Urochloa decumbens TaxID=240449 RepID=A0ABC9G934_9POAL
MLDINLFRTWRRGGKKEDGNPDAVRESQRNRFASVDIVDEVINLDELWRSRQFDLDKIRKDLNDANRNTGKLKMVMRQVEEKLSANKELQKDIEEKLAANNAESKLEGVHEEIKLSIRLNELNESIEEYRSMMRNNELKVKELMESTNQIKERLAATEAEVQRIKIILDTKLMAIGNIVHESVPISDNEENNVILRTWGERRMEGNLKNHVDLCRKLDIVAFEEGVDVAGGRGYFLKGYGVLLNQALINFGLAFLQNRGFNLLHTPFFMRKETMSKCAQLAQFDEELYKVTGDGEEKYLIATAEQPMCAYHLGDRIHPDELPIRYAGYSTCFRKEAGSHGRDTAGIFRVHQFEKIEQFCITSPNGNDSWEMFEEMIKNSEDFYKEIGLAYQVVSIVSGALNDNASKRYDLEAWFPASNTYRELVSCSNCTDYQARRLGIAYGQKSNNKFENYQKEGGVEVPKVLRAYMGGIEFLPFKQPMDGKQAADKLKSGSKVASASGSKVCLEYRMFSDNDLHRWLMGM